MNAQINTVVGTLGAGTNDNESSDSHPLLPPSTIQGDSMQINNDELEVTPTPSTSRRQAKRSRSDTEPGASDSGMEPQMKIPRTKEDIKQFIKTVKEIRDQIKPRYMLLTSILRLLDNELRPLPFITSCNCNNCSSCKLTAIMKAICRSWKGEELNKYELERVAIVAISAAFGSTLTQLIMDKSHLLEIIKFYSKHFPTKANKSPYYVLTKFQKALSDPVKKRWFCYMASMSGKFETEDIGEFYDNWTNWTNTGNIEEQSTRDREPGSYQEIISLLAQFARREIPNYPGDEELMLEVIRELEK